MTTMIDPYYDPHGGITLSRPIALIGFWGSRITEIAVAVSKMSSIPLLDVERSIEHHLGMCLQQFIHQNDLETVQKLEKNIIAKAIDGMATPPIIALRPDSFHNVTTRKYILRRCDTIYIQKNIFLLFSHILDVFDRKELSRNFSIPVSNHRDINQIASCFRDYDAFYQLTHKTIEVEHEHPLKTATNLLQEIQ